MAAHTLLSRSTPPDPSSSIRKFRGHHGSTAVDYQSPELGRVTGAWKDVDSIPLGKDFRRVIADAVGGCRVVLAAIGRDRLTAQDRHGNTRIKDQDDYVSIELTTALQRGIPVIPVLVEQVETPSPEELPERLKERAYRNATHGKVVGQQMKQSIRTGAA